MPTTTTVYLVEWQWFNWVDGEPRTGWSTLPGSHQTRDDARSFAESCGRWQIPAGRPWRIVRRTYADEVVETHDGGTV